METIPRIPFENENHAEMGFEILTLQSLFSRRGKVRGLLGRPHRVEFYIIMYISRKPGMHYIDFHSVPFDEGALLFVSKGQVHAFEVVPGREGFIILFTENFVSKSLIRSDLPSLHRLYDYPFHDPAIQPNETGNVDFGSLFRQIQEEYELADTFAKEEILRSYLKLLLLKAERAKKTLTDPLGNAGGFEKFLIVTDLGEP